ncbi:MAG: endonuclease/exonuclease/phosphatase family protein [Verrucomicrobiia bacterium]|jgi:endonuclease/exonuclease/phosphatase family metal-dependent hydrolase
MKSFNKLYRLSLLIAAELLAFSLCSINLSAGSPPIKVMSFNIRYGDAKDGTNGWQFRKELVLQTIKVFDPDLLGMQEVLHYQGEYLRTNLTEYEFYGIGREDGKQKGESVPVLFKTNRFEAIKTGHFWLSETPEIPGSKSWDSSLPRICTWVLLKDKIANRTLLYINTHFDHLGKVAREESAKLVRKRFAEFEEKYPVIMTGDFNATEETDAYKYLLESGNKKWIDSFRASNPIPTPYELSFHGWKGGRQGRRIDWILHTPDMVTLNSVIDYTSDEGRYPSDHYPVEAVIRYK